MHYRPPTPVSRLLQSVRTGARHLSKFPYLLLIFTTLFWAGNTLVGRAVQGQIPPIGLAFWRWLGGFLLILLPAWPHLQRDWSEVVRSWKIILLLSALGITVFNTLLYTGLQFTTAINALLMQSTMPLMIVVMSYLFFQETLSVPQILGVLISFIGALTIIARGSWQVLTTFSLNQGDLIIFLAMVSYAGYSTLLRLRPALHPLSFLAVTFGCGTLILLPFYLWEHLTGKVMNWTPVTFISLAYVALFPSIIAYLCYNRGIELVGANRASLFLHLIPVFGSIMAVLFLKETPQWFQAVGFLLILLGIFLVIRPQRSSL